MKRLATLAVTVLLTLAAGPAAAQQYPGPTPFQPQFRPQLSPYLLLNRNNAAANYFGFVAPLTNAQPPAAATGVMPTDVTARRRPGLDDPEDAIPQLPQTGHAVRYMNYGSFYNLGNQPRSNALNPFPVRRTR
jgi:hypothetical protein